LTRLQGSGKIRILVFFLLSIAFSLSAQNDRGMRLGGVLAVEVEKDITRRLSGLFEQELRLENNNVGFNRTTSNIGLDYSIIPKKLKVGGFYTYIYMYNKDFLYESRHRFYFNVIYKETFDPITISWRGRFQSTFRDENKGSYRVNPRNIVKNKIEVTYSFFNLPFKPFVSADFSTIVLDPRNNFELSRIRYTGGVNWRLNRTDYLELFLRYDQRMDSRDLNGAAIGARYKTRF
jgi:hypothetical protein